MLGSLSPYSVWDVSPWDGATRAHGGLSLLHSTFLGTVVQTHHSCVSMATQTPIHLTIERNRRESVEMISGAFSSCHLPTPPLPCAFMCTRYGFNSHGLSVVEHRLRARQQKQTKLTAGKVGSCGRVSLPLFREIHGEGMRSSDRKQTNNKNHTKPLRLLSFGDCPASSTASKVVMDVIIQHSLSGLRHPWNLDCVLTWGLGVSREHVCS